MGGQEEHLVFKSIGRERPSMTEDDGLTLAPIFVIDLGAVFDCYRRHENSFLGLLKSRCFLRFSGRRILVK